jgi:hypothetical protein
MAAKNTKGRQKAEIRNWKLEIGNWKVEGSFYSFFLTVSVLALRALSHLCGKSFSPRRTQRHGEGRKQKLETGRFS